MITVFYKKYNLRFWRLVAVMFFALLLSLGQALRLSAFESHAFGFTAEIIDDLPVIETEGGEFCLSETVAVVISSERASSTIIYSINGSDPICNSSGVIYTEPVEIDYDTLLKARICRDNGTQSAVVSEWFEFSPEYCASFCGNSLVEEGEACDDGNTEEGDGCDADCQNEEITKIVINEFLPNPDGADDAPLPGGEWVELYNLGAIAVNVGSWVLYDSDDSHELYITENNTDTGTTTIPVGGFLVVYRDGDSDFALNNSGGDAVRLFDGYPVVESNLIDAYVYEVSADSGKSFARIPDGTGEWIDPIPTPGQPNKLEANLETFAPEIKNEETEILPEEIDLDQISEFIEPEKGEEEEMLIPNEPEEEVVEEVKEEDDENSSAKESFAGEEVEGPVEAEKEITLEDNLELISQEGDDLK